MSLAIQIKSRVAAAVAIGCAGLVLANTADAVDLRDWGRKFPASERFVVLAQFNNEAVLDKETQLVWERTSGTPTNYTNATLECMRATTGGRRGWRIPTQPEIASLITPGATSMPSVFSLSVGKYWTSSEYPSNNFYNYEFAIAVEAPSGLVWLPARNTNQPFVCVRGTT